MLARAVCSSMQCVQVLTSCWCLKHPIVFQVHNHPDWTCPVCRGICNCSAQNCHRSRNGLNPTKMLTDEARDMGYPSVSVQRNMLLSFGHTAADTMAIMAMQQVNRHNGVAVWLLTRPSMLHSVSMSGVCVILSARSTGN